MKKATLKQIADMAGVSMTTVHRALNGKGGCSKDVEEHILRIAREQGYTINLAAASLRKPPLNIALIFPFRDNVKGKTLTFVMQMHDEQGLLSEVLKVVAEYKANILTIHQSIPTNGVATLTLSVEVLPATGDVSSMIETIEAKPGVQFLKILARE